MTAWKSINGANFIRLTLKAFCVDAQPACKHQDVASVLISLLIHPKPTVLPILSHIPLHVPEVCIQASGDRPPRTQSAVCIKRLHCCVLPPVTQQAVASWLHISSRKPRLHQRYIRAGKHCCRSLGLPATFVFRSLVERDSLSFGSKSRSHKSHRDPRMNHLLPSLSFYRHLSQLVCWLSA